MAIEPATVRGGSPDWDVKGSTLKPPPHGTILAEWANLDGGDTGQPVQLGNFGDKSFYASGTIGTSASVKIEGTNEVDVAGLPIGWVELRDAGSTLISFAALPNARQVLENMRFIRPIVAAGTGSGIKCTVYGRKNKLASGG